MKLIRYHEEGPLKPKKTRYRGILYRSRLEARWAVFFDLLEVHYVYEPDIPEVYYIPDFILPHLSIPIYVEIKPQMEGVFSDGYKWTELVKKVKFPLVLLDGLPENRKYMTFYKEREIKHWREMKIGWGHLLSFVHGHDNVPVAAKGDYTKAIIEAKEYNAWDNDSDW